MNCHMVGACFQLRAIFPVSALPGFHLLAADRTELHKTTHLSSICSLQVKQYQYFAFFLSRRTSLPHFLQIPTSAGPAPFVSGTADFAEGSLLFNLVAGIGLEPTTGAWTLAPCSTPGSMPGESTRGSTRHTWSNVTASLPPPCFNVSLCLHFRFGHCFGVSLVLPNH